MIAANKTNQADFWSEHPCGTDGDWETIKKQRFRLEPWIPIELARYPTTDTKYLEVGCGQAVDAITICSQLDESCSYTAIDYSTGSLEQAAENLAKVRDHLNLKVIPDFSQGSALDLAFDDNQFDFVYSLGVIHHTPDPQAAIDEVYRVLRPGGQSVIFLYRFLSLKVGVAKCFRGFQRCVDFIFRKERTVYEFLKKNAKPGSFLGTMLFECFGVPWMEWYTKSDLHRMFGKFDVQSIDAWGFNFPPVHTIKDGKNPNGYFYRIIVKKPEE